MDRPYEQLISRIAQRASGDRESRMRTVADELWDTLSPLAVSWVGFYLPQGDDAMVLGPSRDTPACSPIGLHGACGQSFSTARTLIVRDVADLGEGYIACDPRDRSEIVVPCVDDRGACWAVLDLDSHEVGAFDQRDERGLTAALEAAGLSAKATTPGETAGRRV